MKLSSLADRMRGILDFRDLGPGWLDGEGNSITESSIERARLLLPSLELSARAHIHCYPTGEGFVSLEWDWQTSYGRMVCDVEIGPHNAVFSAHGRAGVESLMSLNFGASVPYAIPKWDEALVTVIANLGDKFAIGKEWQPSDRQVLVHCVPT